MTDTPEQPPKTDVGLVLRKKRQLRGLTHETVHQHTRIPKRLLEALESNDTHAFAAPVYLRGFLKCYCEYLELDFEPLWQELSGQPSSPPPAPAKESRPKAEPTPKPSAKSGGSGMMLPLSDPTLLPFLLIVALLAAGGVLWLLTRGRQEQAALPKLPPPPPPPAAVAPVVPASDLALRVSCARETWIRLAADGVLRFEGRLPSSARPEWKARKGFALRAADPKALRVLLDGATVQLTSFPQDKDGSFLVAR